MFSWKTLWIFTLVFILGVQARYQDGWWGGADDQEKEDEKHDAEILKAVQDSMLEWTARHNNRSRHKRAESNICYPELGCFESTGSFSYLETLPSPPEEISTTFLLYPGRRTTRSITLGSSPLVEIPFNNITTAYDWASKHFNASKSTKILVHGFGSSCHYIWVYEMRSALMSVDDFNIVCVDWERGAELPNYIKAAANARLVAKQLAMLIRGLEERAGLARERIHLIGFSLGAHVAGFAGTEIRNISRITGLDPAGPLFETQGPEARLDPTDATFVDVIHSNGENLFLGGLGSWQPMGDVDFYPNGGRMQKGCTNLFVGAVSDFIWSASEVEGRSLCNHRRAYKFFVDSMSPRCHFPAFPCESYDTFLEGKCFPCTAERRCGNMGYYADKSLGRGQLFLVTRDEEPFCAHQYNVKIESSAMVKPIVNYGKITITLIGESDLNETFIMSKDDEKLMPGASISRMLVPHPIISEPTKVQVLYQGYSGWLSSGLRKWKIDKVSMMDSFGKTSSVCKKGLELESSIPVTLRLYPGDCNIPKDGQTIDQKPYIDDRLSEGFQKPSLIDLTNNSSDGYSSSFTSVDPVRKFVPTPVIHIGNEAIKNDVINPAIRNGIIKETDKSGNENSGWNIYQKFPDNREGNGLEESLEIESNRAFNTKSVNGILGDPNREEIENLKEIVEPILKKPTNKNARSHDLSKPEITEPILGPTTSRNQQTATQNQPTLFAKLLGEKELNYNFYDNADSDWVPSDNTRRNQEGKYLKRHDNSQTIVVDTTTNAPQTSDDSSNPIKTFMMTVQFLPQRLSRMFEQAEKYARETIFPLLSQHTPKFISNFISPKEKQQEPQYVPLQYSESTTKISSNQVKRVDKSDFSPPDVPVTLTRTDIDGIEEMVVNKTTLQESLNIPPDSEATLPKEVPRSNFASLERNTERVMIIYPQNYKETSSTSSEELTSESVQESTEEFNEKDKKSIDFSRIPPDSKVYYDELDVSTENIIDTTTEHRRMYVNLPVFDERDIGVKYIPLVYPDTLKSSEKITKR
ncbi:uncharacterized protein CBL_09914 [Carabus blaptoides fortunei]